MQMSFDRVVGIVGLALSIPGFMLLFFTPERSVAIITLAGSALLLLVSVLLYRLSALPDFTGVRHDSTVLLSANGDAVIQQKYVMRANYAHTTTLTLRNIASDGSSPVFTWNGAPVPSGWIEKRLGEYILHIPLQHPVGRWRTLEGTLEWTACGSFTNSRESVAIAPDRPVGAVEVRVTFPPARMWKHRPGATRLSPSGRVRMPDPVIEDNGNTVRLSVRRVRPGDEFEIFWDW